ncbi:MAG TPA: hypothetical protein VHF06_36035, partial [Pseudonocardiaceae bacterium]|nr:hypothetical protein [Pseudonocardiaceae bacterium]
MSDEEFDTGAAAALIKLTTDEARRSLAIQVPLLYASWGVAWLVGLFVMWLSVRHQAPYQGPTAAPSILFGVLLLGALVVTIGTSIRATRGVHGVSEMQGAIFGVAWPIGFVTLYTVVGALAHAGASVTVVGRASAGGPLLVTGLIYLAGAAIWLDRAMLTIGVWLPVVA